MKTIINIYATDDQGRQATLSFETDKPWLPFKPNSGIKDFAAAKLDRVIVDHGAGLSSIVTVFPIIDEKGCIVTEIRR